MKSQITRIALIAALIAPAHAAHAATLQEWVQTAATIFISHESGHMRVAEQNATEMSYTTFPSYTLALGQYPQKPAILKDMTAKAAVRKQAEDKYTAEYNAHDKFVMSREAAVAGAGYIAQQQAVEQMQGDEKYRGLVLSGLFKTGYVAYHFIDSGNYGDIARSTYVAPTELIVGALITSAASDIYRANTGAKWSIAYFADTQKGAVGLALGGIF